MTVEPLVHELALGHGPQVRTDVHDAEVGTFGEILDELLETLLDDVIQLTGAARGVVLLVDVGGDKGTAPRVRASRNVRSEAIEDPSGAISDSIVRQVIDTKRPIIVSDALTDTTFGKSESVIALKLSSVMCAPLLSQGETVGALYVGNDEVKHLFERKQLDLLTIFAGQASLILQNAMLLSALRADKEKLQGELEDKRFGEIIGACASMMETLPLAASRSSHPSLS